MSFLMPFSLLCAVFYHSLQRYRDRTAFLSSHAFFFAIADRRDSSESSTSSVMVLLPPAPCVRRYFTGQSLSPSILASVPYSSWPQSLVLAISTPVLPICLQALPCTRECLVRRPSWTGEMVSELLQVLHGLLLVLLLDGPSPYF